MRPGHGPRKDHLDIANRKSNGKPLCGIRGLLFQHNTFLGAACAVVGAHIRLLSVYIEVIVSSAPCKRKLEIPNTHRRFDQQRVSN